MSKIILCLLFLVGFINSDEDSGKVQIYDIVLNKGDINEFNVKSGEEFALRFNCVSISWVFLNKDEVKDSLTFIRTGYEDNRYAGKKVGLGRGGYLIYYFKATSVTKEPKLLKFSDVYSYLKQKEPVPKQVIKINIS